MKVEVETLEVKAESLESDLNEEDAEMFGMQQEVWRLTERLRD